VLSSEPSSLFVHGPARCTNPFWGFTKHTKSLELLALKLSRVRRLERKSLWRAVVRDVFAIHPRARSRKIGEFSPRRVVASKRTAATPVSRFFFGVDLCLPRC